MTHILYGSRITIHNEINALDKYQRKFLSRRSCGFCGQLLSRGTCAAIYKENRCTKETMLTRMNNCLSTYKPRHNRRKVSQPRVKNP